MAGPTNKETTTTPNKKKKKKKQDPPIPKGLTGLTFADIDKFQFEKVLVTDTKLAEKENGGFVVGDTYTALRYINADGKTYDMHKITYNNLRKIMRHIIDDSAINKMKKQAILITIGQIKEGKQNPIEPSIDTAERMRHATALRIINVAFGDEFIPDLLEWYSTKDRMAMENGNGAQNERLALRIKKAFYEEEPPPPSKANKSVDLPEDSDSSDDSDGPPPFTLPTQGSNLTLTPEPNNFPPLHQTAPTQTQTQTQMQLNDIPTQTAPSQTQIPTQETDFDFDATETPAAEETPTQTDEYAKLDNFSDCDHLDRTHYFELFEKPGWNLSLCDGVLKTVTPGYIRQVIDGLLKARNGLCERAHGTSGQHDPDPYEFLDATLFRKSEWKKLFGKAALYYFYWKASRVQDFAIKLKGRTQEARSFQDDEPSVSTRNTDTLDDLTSVLRDSRAEQSEFQEKKLRMQESFFDHQKTQFNWQKQTEERKIAHQVEQFEWQKKTEEKKMEILLSAEKRKRQQDGWALYGELTERLEKMRKLARPNPLQIRALEERTDQMFNDLMN